MWRCVGLIALSVAACAGCAAAAPESSGARAAPEPSTPRASGEPEPSAAPEPALAPELPSPAPAAPDAAPAAAGVEPAAEELDLDEWANRHQLEVQLRADGCQSARLGDHPDDLIWCNDHTESKKGIVTYTRSLYAARGKRLVKLIELPIAAGPRDLEGGARAEAERYHVKLVVSSSPGGIELAEAAGLDCAHAEATNKDLATTAPDLHADYVAATKKVCAARGRYVWAGGTLRKSR